METRDAMIDDPSLPTSGQRDHLLAAAGLQAQAALAASPVVDLRELTVVRDGESLLISGHVKCFYHKQLAQETVRPHAAELRMVNTVNVELAESV